MKKSGNETKTDLILKMGGKCSECGYPFTGENQSSFDFHHTDRTKKSTTIALLLQSPNSDAFKNEVSKCQLLCANCHRKHSKKYREKVVTTISMEKKTYDLTRQLKINLSDALRIGIKEMVNHASA